MEIIDIYDISIIIPFYKGNKYLPKLLGEIKKSIDFSENLKIEVIIVNDSPDIDVILPDCSYDIKAIKNNKNRGIHFSRVHGIQVSKGQYILMLDQDDLISENALSIMYENVQGYDIVVCNGFDENPENYGDIYHSLAHLDMVKDVKYYYYIGNMIVSPGQCLIKKAAIPALWHEEVISQNGSDDLLLWLLMMYEHRLFQVNYEKVYLHCDTGNNVSHDYNVMMDSTLEVLEFMKKHHKTSSLDHILKKRCYMRKMYEGKGKIHKLLAYIRYPSISKVLLEMKRK